MIFAAIYSLMSMIFSIAALFQRKQTVAAPKSEFLTALEFERVYQENFEFVWRTIRALGVAPELWDDAVQEVFIVVHRRLDSYVAAAPLRSWIFGVVRRVAGNFRRAKNRRGVMMPLQDETVPAVLSDPYVRSTWNQALSIVLAFSDTLDDDWRSVFVLSELEEMSAPEIAAALNMKLNTVYTRIRILKKRLSQYVTDHFGDERGALYE
ncbi:MAG: sigma-70 family RNA polymerase sigma factor [Deltaproteobacteria bacterium]|nr:sigma-70 family RNA polymerase sigma factor [Deltaproteobacteria bacterium]